jgi:hypothetical protein
MNTRDILKDFRGQAIGSITQQSSSEESFQNEVLRPILKLQMIYFLLYSVITSQKQGRFLQLTIEKLAFIKCHSKRQQI